MTYSSLPERVRALAEQRLRSPVAAWMHSAALAFGDQLAENDAPAHRDVLLPIADWLGFAAQQRDAMGDSLDLLQVAFDYADNLVDAEADAARGRAYQQRYAEIPREVGPCLPALLCSLALERLSAAFGMGATYAIERVVSVLADMARGQGTLDPTLQIELISGKQALLLCLPLWLAPDHHELTPAIRKAIEEWATLWGNTWQLQQEYAELGSAASHFALRQAVARAQEGWPGVGPFRDGERLARNTCLPGPIC